MAKENSKCITCQVNDAPPGQECADCRKAREAMLKEARDEAARQNGSKKPGKK